MSKKNKKDLIACLARMLSEANVKSKDNLADFGKCEWVDLDNNQRCNDNWSEFQCQQVDGTFSEGETCDGIAY